MNEDMRHKYAQGLPFTVTLELSVSALEDDSEDASVNQERDEGEFTIVEVEDCHGNPVLNALEMRLQTLSRDEGFWLDTGIVYI